MKKRYQKAGRKEKGQLVDEMGAVTRRHRKMPNTADEQPAGTHSSSARASGFEIALPSRLKYK
jgi:hypothetical protein